MQKTLHLLLALLELFLQISYRKQTGITHGFTFSNAQMLQLVFVLPP